MKNLGILTFFTVANFMNVECARILAAVLAPSISHQVVYRSLWKELSLRGHQVVSLTTDPMNDETLTNLTEIDLHFSYGIWKKGLDEVLNNPKGAMQMMDHFINVAVEYMDQDMNHPEVKKLINNKDEHFDLFIIELLPVLPALAKRFKCPFIGIFTMDAPAIVYNTIGNPTHPILNPDGNLPFADNLNFLERVQSVIYEIFMSCISLYYEEKFNAVVKKHLNEYAEGNQQEIAKNMSLLFLNTNPVIHQIRPLMPNVIQVGGGLHLQSLKPLPKELQRELDEATEGFIYFSLGSNVKSKALADDVKKALMETFADLPYKVLWKFEEENLPGKPDNVIISKWFPQQDIFKHPNIKLFITQGGIQSVEEAIYDHIPMLGLPFYMDQLANVKRMVNRGLGLSLDYKTLEKETLKETILEIINNPKYRSRVKELADLARDQPMTGLEKAVWWTEYVIRHKGAKHLRSPVLDIPTYQYYLLDVIGFCLFVIFVIIYLTILLFRLIRLIVRKIFWPSVLKVKTN